MRNGKFPFNSEFNADQTLPVMNDILYIIKSTYFFWLVVNEKALNKQRGRFSVTHELLAMANLSSVYSTYKKTDIILDMASVNELRRYNVT